MTRLANIEKMQQCSSVCILALTRAENIRAVRTKISSSWLSLFAGVLVFQFISSVSIQIVRQRFHLIVSDRFRNEP